MHCTSNQLHTMGRHQEHLPRIACAEAGTPAVVARRVANLLKNGLSPRHSLAPTSPEGRCYAQEAHRYALPRATWREARHGQNGCRHHPCFRSEATEERRPDAYQDVNPMQEAIKVWGGPHAVST